MEEQDGGGIHAEPRPDLVQEQAQRGVNVRTAHDGEVNLVQGGHALCAALQVPVECQDLALCPASLRDVLNDGDGELRLAVPIAHERHGEVGPYRAAVLAAVALFGRVAVTQAFLQIPLALDVDGRVVGVGQAGKGGPLQFPRRVAEHLAEGRVAARDAPGHVHADDAHTGGVEDGADLLLRLAQGLFRALAGGDVLDGAFVEEQGAVVVADGAGVLRDPEEAAVAATDLRLEVGDRLARIQQGLELRAAFGLHV